MTIFEALEEKAFENIVGKVENAGNQVIFGSHLLSPIHFRKVVSGVEK